MSAEHIINYTANLCSIFPFQIGSIVKNSSYVLRFFSWLLVHTMKGQILNHFILKF